MSEPKKPATWRPPTRRAFVGMLAAAAAALAIRDRGAEGRDNTRPLWIGHF
jgi:hypothetical protein